MQKDLNMEIGKRLKDKREQLGYSRELFAELIGRSPRFIANFEQGQSGLSFETLKKACLILGISTDYVLFGAVERDYSRIIEMLVHVDEEHFEYVYAILQAYLETYLKNKNILKDEV